MTKRHKSLAARAHRVVVWTSCDGTASQDDNDDDPDDNADDDDDDDEGEETEDDDEEEEEEEEEVGSWSSRFGSAVMLF